MGKPVTAKQLALIIWLPVAIGGLIWYGVEQERAAEARHRATAKAMIDTEYAGRQLARDTRELEAQINAAH